MQAGQPQGQPGPQQAPGVSGEPTQTPVNTQQAATTGGVTMPQGTGVNRTV